jgi:NAD(P)-dependent dehydrogenase (short-subunit alcohol dehydrogenase family)
MQIAGTVALVTGANRGLGAAYARELLDRVAAKVYAAVRDPVLHPGPAGGQAGLLPRHFKSPRTQRQN